MPRPTPHEADCLLGPDHPLTVAKVGHLAHGENVSVAFDSSSCQAMQRSHDALLRAISAGTAIYGVTTGFGPFVGYPSDTNGSHPHSQSLLAHLLTGHGRTAPVPVVRATMLIRAQCLSRGYSGIHPDSAKQLLRLIEHAIHPAIPEVGSVGASGDLTPLAYIAQVMTGRGEVIDEIGNTLDTATAMKSVGLEPITLDHRDALALVNGTSFMSGYLSLACMRMTRLLTSAEQLTGWLYRLLGCCEQALNPRLHEARGHAAQVVSARNITQEAERFGSWVKPHRPLQEIYSIRCAPQILGACRGQYEYVRDIVEVEINGVNDNPLICANQDDAPADVLHGGNFQGQQIAFAADALSAAMTQVGVLAERQITVLANPQLTDGAPMLLAPKPGATSGLAGAQLTATALLADMRHAATPTAFSSIPTNGGNQDIVSMGTAASRRTYEQAERLAGILGVLSIFLSQLDALRENGLAEGDCSPKPPQFPVFTPLLAQDRPLRDDMQRFADFMLQQADA